MPRLGDVPLRFPFVPRYEHRNLRDRAQGGSQILYRVVGDRIDVLHIIKREQLRDDSVLIWEGFTRIYPDFVHALRNTNFKFSSGHFSPKCINLYGSFLTARPQ